VSVARRVTRRLLAPELVATQDWASGLSVELTELRRMVTAAANAQVAYASTSAQTEANRVNLELLKAEVRAFEKTLFELGMALAPATGLEGAGVRFAELREQVNAVSRRLRLLDQAVAATSGPAPIPHHGEDAAGHGSPTAQPGSDVSARAALSLLFDYVAFERRFRGDPDEILRIQSERYLDLLSAHDPVVDLGCGRGELAAVLADRGVNVIGVEPDAGMASEARSRGLDIRVTDAVSFLESCAADSLGAVFSAHVAEHVPFDDLLRIVHLSVEKLKPDGLFVAETPNPATLVVLGNSFILDPTHLRPIHPSLFSFICETAGFRDVRLDFHAPATGYHIAPVDLGGLAQLNSDLQRLNNVLFGAQEYTVRATKRPDN
jgi:SAM-dependent methyltransferase